MQENSTLNILKRLGFVVGMFLLWQLMARAVWATGLAASIAWDSYVSYYYEEGTVQPNWWQSIVDYNPDWLWFIITQFCGAFAAFIAYFVIREVGKGLKYIGAYIAYGPAPKGSRPACADEKCTCAKHKADTFVDGVWVKSVCTNEHCTCKKFHFKQIFKLKKQQWVKVH